jgi:hypothetical protein
MLMKPILIVIALIVVGGVGLGFYLGWFHVSSRTDTSKPNITLTVDKDKIQADKDKAVDKVQDLGQKAENKIEATTQKASD